MDNKLSEAQQLHKELGKAIDQLNTAFRMVIKAYLEGMTDKKPSDALYYFFTQEIEKFCDENPNIEYYDFILSLQLTDDKKAFTPYARELQELLEPLCKKAIEREQSGEPIIELRATTQHKASYKLLESVSKAAPTYYFPNDKIANSLQKLPIDSETYSLKEEKRGNKKVKKVNTYISFDFDEAAKETDLSEYTLNFSEFDKQVQESVVSLMKAGNTIITPAMIHKILTGNVSGARITPKWEEDINRSMRKFNSVFVTVDLSETAKMYQGLEEIEKVIKSTRLMQFETTRVKTKNGSEITAYEMLKEPILYTIADAKNQVGHFEIKELENAKTSNSIDSTELKVYLLKRINAIKRSELSNHILFETLYKDLDRKTTREKRTLRENAEKLLLQFVADKFIESFSIENKGRTPHMIVVDVQKIKKECTSEVE